MGGLSKGSNTSTQTQSSSTAPDPRAYQAYLDLMNRAGGIADTPWNPNTAQRVAGFTDDQNNAFERIRGGIAQPYINKADQYASAAASPITAENISNYYNPYQNDVIDATMANFDTSNNRQLSGVVGNARTSGSLGGDREAVAKALTSQAQTQAQAPVIAGMRQQGYNTALGAAQQDQQRSLQAAGMMGQLGQLAYTDVNALMQSGGMQQGQTQRGYDAYSQNAAAQSAYPFQTAQWLAGIYGGIGPQMGSTTTSTGTRQGPQPNTWSQAAGIGIAALPYLAALRDGGRVASYGSGGSVVTDRGATVADHMRDITDAARYAAGGGIGYVPQINMPSGGGMQPARMDPMQWGADQRTKDIGDYAKEFGDTSKATGDAFKSIGQIGTNIGNAMRTETGSGGAPNGWGNVTTTFPDSMQNASYGLNNTLSGITSGIGSMFGYADGGGVRGYAGGGAPNWNAPAIPITSDMIRGSYDIPAQYEFEQTPMSRFSGQPPPPPMPQSQDDGLAPITDLPIRDQSVGIVPTSSTGDMYAPPPVNVMNPSSGGVGAIPAAAIPSSQQSAPSSSSGVMGWLDGIRKAIASDESKAALGRMGATMMAESGQGGKGSFGIHAGKGIIAGMDARDAYVKSEREAKINAAKMDLAQRAAAIQEAQEGRAVRAAPYELQMAKAKATAAEGDAWRASDMHSLDKRAKTAASALHEAQAEAGKYLPFDPDKAILNAKTGAITQPNRGGANKFERAWMDKEAPKRYTELNTAGREVADTLATLEEMKAIAPHASTGIGAEYILAGRKLGERVGLDLGSGKIAPTELLQALSTKFAIAAAAPLKPVSNTDLDFIQKSFLTIAKSPETIKDLLPQMEAAARRLETQVALEQEAIRNDRIPDARAIADEAAKRYPSTTKERYAPARDGATSTAQSGGIRPNAATAAPTVVAPTAADIARRAAIPDGSLVMIPGRPLPHIKRGDSLIEAPKDSYTRGLFGGYMKKDSSFGPGSTIPTLD